MSETRKTDEEIRERIDDLQQWLRNERKEKRRGDVETNLLAQIDSLRWVLAE